MSLQLSTVMLAVEDLERSTRFYVELGAAVLQDYPQFKMLSLGEGSSTIALYERQSAASDAGVSAEGSGFAGVSFHCIVEGSAAVDDIITAALAAGGSSVKTAAGAPWGGYYGYFADPDGHLWKVASS